MPDISDWGVDDWVAFSTPPIKVPPLYQQLVSQCNKCGSLIVDQRMHDQWHDKLEETDGH